MSSTSSTSSCGATWLRDALGVDLRSLAACRIALALVLLVDLAWRWNELEAFLAPDSIFSLQDWRRIFHGTSVWTMHNWLAASQWPAVLLAAQCLLAFMLLLGAATRVATFGSWLFALSLHMRNPAIINSGDTFLRMMLLWGILAPWANVWSIDAWRRRRGAQPSSQPSTRDFHASSVLGPALLLMLQVTFVYVITGWVKINQVWLAGEAMERVMGMDYVLRPWGRVLGEHPALLYWITVFTPWFELAVVLVWLPWKTSAVRTLLALAFIAFHAGIELTVHVGLFGIVSQASWLLFLPGAFWDRIGLRLREADKASAASVQATQTLAPSPTHGQGPTRVGAAIVAAVALLSFGANAYVNLLANQIDPPPLIAQAVEKPELARGSHGGYQHLVQLAPWVRRPLDALGLSQDWTMFRNPPLECTWPVADGTLADGRSLDLLRNQPLRDDGAPETAANLPSQHWRYFFRRLTFPQYHFLADRTAQQLLDDWNRQHPDEPAVHVRLVFYKRQVRQVGLETQVIGVAGTRPDADTLDIDEAIKELEDALDLELP